VVTCARCPQTGFEQLDYFAPAYWHAFRFRFGEMIGLDRTRRLGHRAANIDEDGRFIS
jgi:NADH:ubiquinone reductase (H+-translocating)